MLLLEKKNYIFRNERHMTGKSVLFPGCNFPCYPSYQCQILSQVDMGVLFDCCGKPVSELGLKEQEGK